MGQSQPQLHSEFKDSMGYMRPLNKAIRHCTQPWACHYPWGGERHGEGALTMYSMLEAGGYTWPRSLLCSMRISWRSDMGMALRTRECGSACWYLLSNFSRLVTLGRRKACAPQTSRASPIGTTLFRRQLMAPHLQPQLRGWSSLGASSRGGYRKVLEEKRK